MKVTVDGHTFEAAVRAVRSFAGREPFLTMVQDGEDLALQSACDHGAIAIRIPAQFDTDSSSGRGVRMVTRMLATSLDVVLAGMAHEDMITMTADGRDNQLTLSRGQTTLTLPVRYGEYPHGQEHQGPCGDNGARSQHTMACQHVHAIVHLGAACAETDDPSRPGLMCAWVSLTPAGVVIASSDGCQLAVAASRPIDDLAIADLPFALISAKALKMALKAVHTISGSDEPLLSITLSSDGVVIGNRTVQVHIPAEARTWPVRETDVFLRDASAARASADWERRRDALVHHLNQVVAITRRFRSDHITLTIRCEGDKVWTEGRAVLLEGVRMSLSEVVNFTHVTDAGEDARARCDLTTTVSGAFLTQAWKALRSLNKTVFVTPIKGRHALSIDGADAEAGIFALRIIMPLESDASRIR